MFLKSIRSLGGSSDKMKMTFFPISSHKNGKNIPTLSKLRFFTQTFFSCVHHYNYCASCDSFICRRDRPFLPGRFISVNYFFPMILLFFSFTSCASDKNLLGYESRRLCDFQMSLGRLFFSSSRIETSAFVWNMEERRVASKYVCLVVSQIIFFS